MKVKELMGLLAELHDSGQSETEVVFAYPSGDHWRTVIAGTIDKAAPGLAKHSTYHGKLVIVAESDEDEDDIDRPSAGENGMIRVIILE